MKNKNLILWIIVILLSVTFSLSFIKTSSKEKRKPVKTALLNPKYKETVKKLILYDSSNAIELNFNGSFWTINNPTNPENSLPADNIKVKNFIEKLSEITNMYKISDNLSQKNDFGLQSPSTFHVIYYSDSDNSKFTDLIFGNHDFSQQFRYFMTGNSSTVYEINTSFDSYLSSKVSAWNEGFIISKNIIKTSDIQKITISDFLENTSKTLTAGENNFSEYSLKLLELRQGGFPEDLESFNKEHLLSVKIDFGNLDQIILDVFSSQKEGEYFLKEKYFPNNSLSYEYLTKISAWTYSKLQ